MLAEIYMYWDIDNYNDGDGIKGSGECNNSYDDRVIFTAETDLKWGRRNENTSNNFNCKFWKNKMGSGKNRN